VEDANLAYAKIMIDADQIRRELYTRQQIAKLTGLDDSTLNYWMREGVLRPADGKAGKGQHRRFPYHQVNLALLLSELRKFGVSLPEMKRLALRFHEGIAAFDRLGITRDNEPLVDSVLAMRRDLDEYGHIRQSMHEDRVALWLEVFPWLEGRPVSRSSKFSKQLAFEVTLQEALEISSKAHIIHDREPDDRIPDEVVNLGMALDREAYQLASRYWRPITYVETQMPSETTDAYYYYTPHYLYRNEEEEWEITFGDPLPSLTSYVAIKLDLISVRAWSKLA
jgi:DNA-binding transcriptional MerR regulator